MGTVIPYDASASASASEPEPASEPVSESASASDSAAAAATERLTDDVMHIIVPTADQNRPAN